VVLGVDKTDWGKCGRGSGSPPGKKKVVTRGYASDLLIHAT